MKKIAVMLAVLLTLSGCNWRGFSKQTPQAQAETPGTSPAIVVNDAAVEGQELMALDTIAVNRSMVAKMIALTMLTPEEIEDQPYTAEFADVSQDEWYAKYINAAVRLNILSGGADGFRPDQPLSISEAQIIIDRMNTNNKTTIKITEETKDLPISYALWSQLYLKTAAAIAGVGSGSLENMETVAAAVKEKFGIGKEGLVVLATSGTTQALPNWHLATSQGLYTAEGLGMDGYIDKEVGAYTKGGEVVILAGVTNETPTVANAYLCPGDAGAVKVMAGGVHRSYRLAEGLSAEGASLADITLENGTITGIAPLTEQKTGEIKRLTDSYIELPEGRIERSADMKVFAAQDGRVSGRKIDDLIVGTTAAFYLKEGKAVAAVMPEKALPERMRVLISTGNYNARIHPQAVISCDKGLTIHTKEGEKQFAPGEEVAFSAGSNKDLFGSERIYVEPSQPEGRIELRSLKRGEIHPQYRGVLEISKEGEGFLLVNVLDLEQYLYAVVASQIPESLGSAAAKAQSIVARSNAVNQFALNRWQEYGAQVDDSIQCQLYAAVPENPTAIEAVDATKDMVLEYEGDVIKPTFFLASSGFTGNSGETWAKSGKATGKAKFPAETPEYLSAQKQVTGTVAGSLAEEAAAQTFFKNPATDAYESQVSWVRWQVRMTRDEVEAAINNNILPRSTQYPAQVKTLAADGSYEQKPVETIGQLKNLSVVQRGEGGNIMQMKIEGTSGTFLIETESCIRALIKPYQYMAGKEGIRLTRADGTQVENYGTMPSAFYTFEIQRDDKGGVQSIQFYGGGNGHGVGMSQCGAQSLADQGIALEEILKHYYRGTTIGQIHQ